MITKAAGETAQSTPTITFSASVPVDAPPETTFGLLADPKKHLEWCGTRAPNDSFKLLTLDAPDEPAHAGTTFTSTGANGKRLVFHDQSVIKQLTPPNVFAFTTESRLARKHRPTWHARFEHRYQVSSEGAGSRVDYIAEVYPLNYRPYWLHPMMRPMTRILVPRMMTKNLKQLARMAEESAKTPAG